MPFSKLLGRTAYAILSGVVIFLVVFILGVVLAHFDATIGGKLEQFSPIIGVLAGIVVFFAYPVPPVV